VDDTLQNTLNDLLRSGAESNPALNALLADYVRYHVASIVVAGLFLIGLAALSALSWLNFRSAEKSTAQRRTYLGFGIVSLLVALMLALLIAANLSSVLDPRQGFAGAIGLLSGQGDAELRQAFTTWLQSGSAEVPSAVQAAIDDRIAWQAPKAGICALLLVGFGLLSFFSWRAFLRKPRALSLLAGMLTALGCLVLMLMVIGNTQGALAPLALTLFYN
jgi:phosphotransferase system  glucose/maltose/N-acetylglucosamine-specific IIC component